MGCFSKWDIGGCGCGNDCAPCSLPAQDLSLAWTFTCAAAGGTLVATGTTALVYQGVVAGAPTWQTACIATGLPFPCTPAARWTITCDPTAGTTYDVGSYGNTSCAGSTAGHQTWNSINGTTTGNLRLTSSSCSPLNLVFAGTWAGTITP